MTVTSVTDPKDSSYLIYRSKLPSNVGLESFLSSHLIVYTKFDEDKDKYMIDYVALSQQSEQYRRSATMTLTGGDRDNSLASKKKKTNWTTS